MMVSVQQDGEDNLVFKLDETNHTKTVSLSQHGKVINDRIWSTYGDGTSTTNGHVTGANSELKYSKDNKKDVKENTQHDLVTSSSADNVGKSEFSRCQNPEYKTKIITTVCIMWEMIALGCVYGQMGPTLPDLRLISNSSLEQATWLFTGFSIGYLIGCFTSGIIGKRISEEGIIFLSTFTCSFSVVVLPWIPSLIGMVIIRVIIGMCIGGQDTGSHSLLFKIWGADGGPFLQLVHAIFAVGGVLSPLLAKPFLMKTTYDGSTTNLSSCTIMNGMNSSMNTSDSNLLENTTNQSNNNTCSSFLSTDVQYAYMITGGIVISSSLTFLMLTVRNYRIEKKKDAVASPKTTDTDKGNKLSRLKITQVCLLLVISYLATSMIDLFPSLLTTFMMSELDWTQQSAATLTSIFFIAYGVGNFINIFTLLRVSTTKVILASYGCGLIALACLVVGVFTDIRIIIWISVAFFAVSFSSILPTLYTWIQNHVTPITSTISSSLLVFGSLGVMVNPVLMGYLMDNVSTLWFLYMSCGEAVFCFIIFCIVLLLRRLVRKKDTSNNDITITHL
ncbi:hypothetical protein ACF0H5_012787 [Mactra antiquata]